MSQSLTGQNSALIVWDMQYGIASAAFNLKEVTEKINRLRGTAHELGIPVIYSQQTKLPYEYMSKFQMLSLQKRGHDPKTSNFMAPNTHEWEILPELLPEKGDVVIQKNTPDFFIGTNVDQLLRSRGVEMPILTGVSTEIGIEATARHAAYLGYLPVVVEDAVGSRDKEMHDLSLRLMRHVFDLRNTETVLNSMKKA
jgi:nicotinamidase-related amidase